MGGGAPCSLATLGPSSCPTDVIATECSWESGVTEKQSRALLENEWEGGGRRGSGLLGRCRQGVLACGDGC